jgi:hypothetical protein
LAGVQTPKDRGEWISWIMDPLLGDGQVDLWIHLLVPHIGHGQETDAYVVDKKKVTDRWA